MTTPQLAIFVLITMVIVIVNILALIFHAKMDGHVTPFRPAKTKQPRKPLRQAPAFPQHESRPLPEPPPKAPFPRAA